VKKGISQGGVVDTCITSCTKFLQDFVCQKLLKSVYFLPSY